MSARSDLRTLLKPALPPKWDYIDDRRTKDFPAVPFAYVTQQELKPHPAAPRNTVEVEFLVALVDPRQSPKAEDALDEHVHEFVAAVRAIKSIRWTSAKRTKFTGELPAYDLTIYVSTTT